MACIALQIIDDLYMRLVQMQPSLGLLQGKGFTTQNDLL